MTKKHKLTQKDVDAMLAQNGEKEVVNPMELFDPIKTQLDIVKHENHYGNKMESLSPRRLYEGYYYSNSDDGKVYVCLPLEDNDIIENTVSIRNGKCKWVEKTWNSEKKEHGMNYDNTKLHNTTYNYPDNKVLDKWDVEVGLYQTLDINSAEQREFWKNVCNTEVPMENILSRTNWELDAEFVKHCEENRSIVLGNVVDVMISHVFKKWIL